MPLSLGHLAAMPLSLGHLAAMPLSLGHLAANRCHWVIWRQTAVIGSFSDKAAVMWSFSGKPLSLGHLAANRCHCWM